MMDYSLAEVGDLIVTYNKTGEEKSMEQLFLVVHKTYLLKEHEYGLGVIPFPPPNLVVHEGFEYREYYFLTKSNGTVMDRCYEMPKLTARDFPADLQRIDFRFCLRRRTDVFDMLAGKGKGK